MIPRLLFLLIVFIAETQAQSSSCKDSIGPNGVSDCPSNKDLCDEPLWKELMTEQCPLTCGVCTTNNSIEIDQASFDFPALIASLNQDLEPCDNFYAYVCDGYIKNNPLEEKQAVSHLDYIQKTISDRTFAVLENNRQLDGHQEDPYISQLYTFYDTCINEQKRNQDGSMVLLQKLASVKASPSDLVKFGTDWLINAFPFGPISHYDGDVLPKDYAGPFFNILFNPSLFDSSKNVANINPAGFNEFFEKPLIYVDPEYEIIVQNYAKYLTTVLEVLIQEDSTRNGNRVFAKPVDGNWSKEIERRVNSLIQIETSYAKAQLSLPMRDEAEIKPENQYEDVLEISLGEFQSTYAPSIDWSRYLETLLGEQRTARLLKRNGISSLEEMIVEVSGADLFMPIESIIRTAPAQVMSDYLEWQIIYPFLPHLTGTIAETRKNFGGQFMLTKNYCKEQAFTFFAHIIDALYMDSFFPEKTREQMEDLFGYVEEAFADMIDDVDWMDEDTREYAHQKLEDMMINMGYSTDIFDDRWLDNLYRNYSLKPTMSYLEMLVSLESVKKTQRVRSLAQATSHFISATRHINAFYLPSANAIFALASFLNTPFYNKDFPDPMIFGSIGSIIAHELTHGYDSLGSQHDADGNVYDWWDPETKASFQEEKKCFIDQYSSYLVKINKSYSLPINGVKTQGENIADNGGIRAAYMAMQNFLDDVDIQVDERFSAFQSLRGLEEFSDEQMFFIATTFVSFFY